MDWSFATMMRVEYEDRLLLSDKFVSIIRKEVNAMAGFGRFKLTDALPQQPARMKPLEFRRRPGRLSRSRQGEGQRQGKGQVGGPEGQAVSRERTGRGTGP